MINKSNFVAVQLRCLIGARFKRFRSCTFKPVILHNCVDELGPNKPIKLSDLFGFQMYNKY